ncbi:MAG: hypothetical protein WCK63_04115 [Betaproteobacteria bacterium]
MKIIGLIVTLLLVGLFGANSAWAYHGGRAHFGVYVGGPYWGPSYYSPYSYYPPPYSPAYYPPVVVAPAPAPVYIQQPTAPAAPAPVAPVIAEPANFWYFCAASKNYYPYVSECPGGWKKVSPQPQNPR